MSSRSFLLSLFSENTVCSSNVSWKNRRRLYFFFLIDGQLLFFLFCLVGFVVVFVWLFRKFWFVKWTLRWLWRFQRSVEELFVFLLVKGNSLWSFCKWKVNGVYPRVNHYQQRFLQCDLIYKDIWILYAEGVKNV